MPHETLYVGTYIINEGTTTSARESQHPRLLRTKARLKTFTKVQKFKVSCELNQGSRVRYSYRISTICTCSKMAEAGPSCSNDTSTSRIPTAEERLQNAADYKNTGNERYKNKDYKGAIGKYHRALMFIKDLDMGATRRDMSAALGLARPAPGQDQMGSTGSHSRATIPQYMLDQAADIELSCLNNLAASLLQLPEPDYSKIEYYCNQVLERCEKNGKALYRRGVARYHLHDYEGAHDSLSKAQEISPGDSNIKRYIQLCDKAMIKQAKDERTRYRGMFDKLAAQGDN